MRRESEVLAILKDPHSRQWTLQGFGMLRTYLDPDEVERLHIWDTGMSNDDVSTVHNHAWDFTSLIYSGRLANQRYVRDGHDVVGSEWQSAVIKPGECGGIVKPEPGGLLLSESPREYYVPGMQYSQDAPELHESLPSPGTVTIIRRTFHNDRSLDLATVAWKAGDWVTAEPRVATPEEVAHFAAVALEHWGQ